MDWRVIFVSLLGLLAGFILYNYSSQPATHYIRNDYISTIKISSSSGYPLEKYPKITAILAYKQDCLYCDIVRDDLKSKVNILKELNVENPVQYKELLSYLNRLNIEYQGVPTVLIGKYAFFSYQQTYDCPTYSTEVEVTVGNVKVKLCRLNNQPNYYVYIPDRVAELINACKATNHPSCFLT